MIVGLLVLACLVILRFLFILATYYYEFLGYLTVAFVCLILPRSILRQQCPNVRLPRHHCDPIV